MANFKNISVKEWKKLSEEQQKGFKEVITEGFLGINKKSLENKTEEGRAVKLDRDISKKNLKLMSGLWKQSKITSTAVKVTSSHWGKLLALGMFLLPKKFWTGLGETLIRVFNFFKNFDFKKITMGKVIAGFTALAALLNPSAALTLAILAFKTTMLGFKGIKGIGNKFTTPSVGSGAGLGAAGQKNARGATLMSKMVPILGTAGKVLGWVGVGIAAGDALGKGFFSENMKGKSFGDKITTTLAEFASNMTFGLLDAKWTKNLLDNIGSTITNGVKSAATSLTTGIILGLDSVAKHITTGLDFVRNFDWDKEVERLKAARKDPVKKGDLKGARAQVEHLTNVAQTRELTDPEKGQLKESQKQLGQEPLGALKVASVDKQRQEQLDNIARAQAQFDSAKEKMEQAKGKFLPGSDKAKATNLFSVAKRNLRTQKSSLSEFDSGGASVKKPEVSMGAMNTSDGFKTNKTGKPDATMNFKSSPHIPDDGGTTNMTGVKWNKMHTAGKSGIESAIWEVYNKHGKKPVFTSGLRDKDHPLYNPKSQHAFGLGFDLRSNGLGAKKSLISSDLSNVFNREGWFMQEEVAGQSNTTGTSASGSHFHIHKAAKGFHGVVESATGFIAGEAGKERVDITPLNGPNAKLASFNNLQNQNLDAQRMGSGGGTTVIAPTTNNNSSQATTAMLSNPSAKDTSWNSLV